MDEKSYNFDYIFIDEVCPSPYITQTLQDKGMGGSESTVIKIAESLGAIDLNVAVYEHNLKVPMSGQYAFYIDKDNLFKCADPKVCIQMRSLNKGIIEMFPTSKHVIWCHDNNQNSFVGDMTYIIEHNITMVCVSRWHYRQFKLEFEKAGIDILSSKLLTYIYNPIHDRLFDYRIKNKTYDPLKLVWTSSPHKDLEHAIEIFREIRNRSNLDFKLHIYNPGYLSLRCDYDPNIIVHDSVPNHKLILEISDALCLFMPMDKWRETFCIVSAECNAIGVPTIAYRGKDALDETAQFGSKLCNDREEVIKKVLQWRRYGRPEVRGNDNYKLSNVVKYWLQFLPQ